MECLNECLDNVLFNFQIIFRKVLRFSFLHSVKSDLKKKDTVMLFPKILEENVSSPSFSIDKISNL